METVGNVKSAIRMSQEAFDNLIRAERNLHDLLPEMDKMEECGIDCQVYRIHLRQQLERMEKLKLYYAP